MCDDWPDQKADWELSLRTLRREEFSHKVRIVLIKWENYTTLLRGKAHDPKIAAARALAGETAVISAPDLDLDKGLIDPEEQPHRPWLVPGAGAL